MDELKGLTKAAREWAEDIFKASKLTPSGKVLVVQAALALDTAERANARIRKEGLTLEGRYGAKVHPLVSVERDARNVFVKIARMISLEG